MSLESAITLLAKSPKKIFLIDALGAFITALSMSLLLAQFQTFFGMPVSTLYLLSGIAVGLSFYSFSLFIFARSALAGYLTLLISLNSLYCLVSTTFVFIHFDALTSPGLVYFTLELLIITSLILVEIKVLRHLKSCI